jgi:Tol biopolymer transport system component
LSKTGLYKIFTNPGAGVHNNIWIISRDAAKAWQVTHVAKEGGVLHPHFSADGRQLCWAEKLNNKPNMMGTWEIKIADVRETAEELKVSNVRGISPGKFQWYETHGFSADGSTVLFSAMKFGGAEKDFDLYSYNLKSEKLIELTDPQLEQWDEHGHFVPGGKQIIWMSSMGIDQKPGQINTLQVKTDYWIMNIDGTNKKRLTYFNDPKSAYHMKAPRIIAADVSLQGDGRFMYGYIQHPGTAAKPGSIVRMELK